MILYSIHLSDSSLRRGVSFQCRQGVSSPCRPTRLDGRPDRSGRASAGHRALSVQPLTFSIVGARLRRPNEVDDVERFYVLIERYGFVSFEADRVSCSCIVAPEISRLDQIAAQRNTVQGRIDADRGRPRVKRTIQLSFRVRTLARQRLSDRAKQDVTIALLPRQYDLTIPTECEQPRFELASIYGRLFFHSSSLGSKREHEQVADSSRAPLPRQPVNTAPVDGSMTPFKRTRGTSPGTIDAAREPGGSGWPSSTSRTPPPAATMP